MAHLLPRSIPPLCFSDCYEALFYCPEVNLHEGRNITQRGNRAESVFCNLFYDELHNSTCLLTDGSRGNDSPFAGYAIVSQDSSTTLKFRTSSFVSSYCVEAMAILQALRLGFEHEWPNLVIFSDSKSVLSAIESPYKHRQSSYLILQIKPLMYQMCKLKNIAVKLIWIPAHSGIVQGVSGYFS